MPKFYSPKGNLEVWKEQPEGYFTIDEWAKAHPPEVPEQTKEERLMLLDNEYTFAKENLLKVYTDAQIHGDTETMDAVRAEMADLDQQYDAAYTAANEEG